MTIDRKKQLTTNEKRAGLQVRSGLKAGASQTLGGLDLNRACRDQWGFSNAFATHGSSWDSWKSSNSGNIESKS